MFGNTEDEFLLVELLHKGGWVMYPLLFCSLLSLAVAIERFLYGPTRKRVIPKKLFEEANRLIAEGRIDELVGLCRADESALAKVILTVVKHLDRPRAELMELLESTGRRIALELQRYLSVLGTISTLSPLLGLLGTVLGLIRTFTVMKSLGLGSGPALAAGISEALIATASGLVVAIPSLVFYRFFLHRSKTLLVELEGIALNLVDQLTLKPANTEGSALGVLKPVLARDDASRRPQR